MEPLEHAERITRQGISDPGEPAPLGGIELNETGAIWELLSFHRAFKVAIDELERKLETVLKPEPAVSSLAPVQPVLESPIRGEIRAMDGTLERLRDLTSRLDL